jgi:hypothetical protein
MHYHRNYYQGTTFRSPFFFLLLDSFCPFELSCDPSAGFAVASVVASAAGGVVASVFASPPVPVVVVVFTGFVAASGAAGGAGGVDAAFGSPAAPGLGGDPSLAG